MLAHPGRRAHVALGIVLGAAVAASSVPAQGPSAATPLTLVEAVRFAITHHPVVGGASARLAVARASREVAEAGRLPTVDLAAQVNRATGNVVAGSSFPIGGLPAVSGPVGTTALDGGTWGTTAGLVSAVPLTGFVRASRIAAARSAEERAAAAGLDGARLDVAFGAATAYLRAMATTATLRAAVAGASRARTLFTSTEALVNQQLRPGADLARARAELADAERDVARAERERGVADALLADALGSATEISIRDAVIVTGAPAVATSPSDRHPAVREARETGLAADRERDVAAIGWWPRVDVVGALWGRGSGVPVNGAVAAAMHDGLYPGVSNWAVGLSASWPLLGFSSVAAESRRVQAVATLAAERLRATESAVGAARRAALADAAGAAEVAQRAAVALDAARVALDQSTARYEAGLTTVTEVADTQRLLARAEAADAVARIDIVLTRLAVARSAGDLTALLAEASAASAP